MNELDEIFAKRIREDLAKNPEYRLFIEQDNYIDEEAVQYVLFILDYYIKNGGTVSAEKIQLLFSGLSKSKTTQLLKTLEVMHQNQQGE